MLNKLSKLSLIGAFAALMVMGCNDAGLTGIDDGVDESVASERGTLAKFNFTSVQADIKNATFTVCKMAPEDPAQSFTFTTVAAPPPPNTPPPTIVPSVDLEHLTCEDVAISNSTLGNDITITETVPPGWVSPVPSVQVWNIDQGGNVTGPIQYGPTNSVTGKITDIKDGCLVIFHNRKEPTGGGQGCTPGYWKNNWDKKGGVSWGPTGISGGDPLSSVGFSGFTTLNGDATSFIDALNARGGGERALMRHAAAAVLNAAHPDVSYDLTVLDIVDLVNAALAGGNVEAAKNTLADFNEQGCPIDQQGRVN